jgi:hypothetical protein
MLLGKNSYKKVVIE